MIVETRKKIEHYLYSYSDMDKHIQNIESDIADPEYSQTYDRWIKNKSSGLEDQVIKNIDRKKRILKIRKWQKLITFVLEWYKTSNIKQYHFIRLKYIEKASANEIEKELNLSFKQQEYIKDEILHYIFSICVKKELLREVY